MISAAPTRPVGWEITHVDLQQGIPALPAVSYACKGRYVVIWHGNIPLGHCEILSAELPLSSAQFVSRLSEAIAPAVISHLLPQWPVRLPCDLEKHDSEKLARNISLESILELNNPLQKLSNPSSHQLSKASISVIICTRDRPQQLQACLRAIQSMTDKATEIIVVDNAPSSDATEKLVAGMSGIRYVKEPRPGLNIARNTGIQNSRSDIVAFTDDDVQVHPNWLWGIRYAFRDPEVFATTGLVLPVELETEAQEIFEKYWSFSRGYQMLDFDAAYFRRLQPWGVPAWCVGAGANMAFWRSLFERVGLFDERLDVGAAGCSGDSELWYRVMAAGYTCRYEPAAVVFHQHRRDLDGLKRQMFGYMRGHTAALLVQFEKTRHWGNLRRLLVSLPRYYAGLLKQRLMAGYMPRYCTLFREIKGCFSGVWFYVNHH